MEKISKEAALWVQKKDQKTGKSLESADETKQSERQGEEKESSSRFLASLSNSRLIPLF